MHKLKSGRKHTNGTHDSNAFGASIEVSTIHYRFAYSNKPNARLSFRNLWYLKRCSPSAGVCVCVPSYYIASIMDAVIDQCENAKIQVDMELNGYSPHACALCTLYTVCPS